VDDSPTDVDANVRRAIGYLDEAAALGCDIVCLPEHFNVFNVPGAAGEQRNAAESVPGPLSDLIAAQAAKHKMNVVANFPVIDQGTVYNQTTFYTRTGDIAGFYRKLQPTAPEHYFNGVSPGDQIPVIKMDFGIVGCIICFDLYFPEIVRILAMKGAEIVFWPTMAHGPSEFNLETQLRARAMDYSVYMVEANYSVSPPYAPYAGRCRPGRARIVDFDGHIIADTGHRPGIAFADVDLDEIRLGKSIAGIHDPDLMRTDLEDLVRLDFYAAEFTELSRNRKRPYSTGINQPSEAYCGYRKSDHQDRLERELAEMRLQDYRIVDLSLEIVPNADEDRPMFLVPGRLSDNALKYDVRTHTHVGTHVESPGHFFEKPPWITDLPVDSYIARGVLAPIALEPSDPAITGTYLESVCGDILFKGDALICRNDSSSEPDHTPYFTRDAAMWIKSRGVSMFGFDNLKLGRNDQEGREFHRLLMEDGVLFVEFLANLQDIRKREFIFFALPIRIRDVDSTWVRAIALEKK
jgi:predicted amidohydrolase/kynurenine formamidase